MATRAAMHRSGAAVLTQLLNRSQPIEREVACGCGQRARYHQLRPKQLLTAVGRVQIERPYYWCVHCQQGHSPRDWQLDVEGTQCSPALRRMMALVGSQTSFDHGRQQLHLLAGLEVTAKAVERHAEAIGADVARREQDKLDRAVQLELPAILGKAVPRLYIQIDGTGVPMVRAETSTRPGKIQGQPARTREVKLGCVFTQTRYDEQGRPLRDEASTTYVGAIETAAEFGRRIYIEAWERGWSRAQQKVLLGDGAPWIWNLAHEHFPAVIEIVDIWHAREHLWMLGAKLYPAEDQQRRRWVHKMIRNLDAGCVESLVKQLRAVPARQTELRDLLTTEANYFERNRERMRYPAFRRQGLFIGSGVIEAACKTVIGARLKQSGMFWTVRGANAIIALRCNRLSGKFEDYWETRARAA